jgi:hypothetical protein
MDDGTNGSFGGTYGSGLVSSGFGFLWGVSK